MRVMKYFGTKRLLAQTSSVLNLSKMTSFKPLQCSRNTELSVTRVVAATRRFIHLATWSLGYYKTRNVDISFAWSPYYYFLAKLVVIQLVHEFLTFYKTRRFITMFTRASQFRGPVWRSCIFCKDLLHTKSQHAKQNAFDTDSIYKKILKAGMFVLQMVRNLKERNVVMTSNVSKNGKVVKIFMMGLRSTEIRKMRGHSRLILV